MLARQGARGGETRSSFRASRRPRAHHAVVSRQAPHRGTSGGLGALRRCRVTERGSRRTHAIGTPLRTYSHLSEARKVPDDYDLSTTALHYYVKRGFEVKTPIQDWYAKYQAGSPLRCSNWDLFADPARTTYT